MTTRLIEESERYAAEMVGQYLESAEWTSEWDLTQSDIEWAPEALATAKRDCIAFMVAARALLADDARIDAEQCGHDLWLTRNHHGVGFWDRGLGDLGEQLTALAQRMGGCDAYVGDDGYGYLS